MERRNILKTVGGIAVTASAGGAGVLATTGGTAAAAEIGEFDISDGQIETDDGTINEFTVEPDVTLEYDGLDDDAAGVVVNFGVLNPDHTEENPDYSLLSEAENDPNSRVEVSEADSLDTRAGTYTWDFPEFDVLANSDWEAADFEADTDGASKTTEVEFYVSGAIRKAGGGTASPPGRVSDVGSIEITVTNEEATADTGVSGDTNLGGTDQDS